MQKIIKPPALAVNGSGTAQKASLEMMREISRLTPKADGIATDAQTEEQPKRFPTNYWKSKRNRIKWTKWLVAHTGKKPADLLKGDFEEPGLLRIYTVHGSSVYNAVIEAYPELGIRQWEMKVTPRGFFSKKENRVAAMRWIVETKGVLPAEITSEILLNNGMSALLVFHKHVIYSAVNEAFPEMDINPWQMKIAPQGFFHEKQNRRAVLEWVLQQQDRDPRDLETSDFHKTEQYWLITYYKGSPHRLLSDLMPELGIMQWEMKKCQKDYFSIEENRIAAIKWLVKKLEINPNDLKYEHFKDNRLGGLLRQGGYNGSVHRAVCEAYPELKEGRKGMHHVSKGVHQKKKKLDGKGQQTNIVRTVKSEEFTIQAEKKEAKNPPLARPDESNHSAPGSVSKGIAKKEAKPEKREKIGGKTCARLDAHDHRMLADMDRMFGGGNTANAFSLPRETTKRPFNLDSIGKKVHVGTTAPDERKWSPENALPLQEEILAEKHDGERWRRETRDCMRYCREMLVAVSGKANIRLTVTHNSTCFPWSVANGNGSPLLKIDIQYEKGKGTYSYGEDAGSFSIRDLDTQMIKIASLLASQQTSN